MSWTPEGWEGGGGWGEMTLADEPRPQNCMLGKSGKVFAALAVRNSGSVLCGGRIVEVQVGDSTEEIFPL